MCGAMDKLQGDVSLTSNTQMLDCLSSPRGGYHTTSKAGAKRQAPQAKAQVNPSFQGGINPNSPFMGRAIRLKPSPLQTTVAGVEELVSPAGVVIDYPITPNCEGNEDDILQGSDFEPITRENSQQARLLLCRLVHDRCSPMGPENSNAGISYPLCSVPPDIRANIQPHLSPRMGKVEVAESGSAGDAGQGCERAGTLLTTLLQLSRMGVREADLRSVSPQHPHKLPELHFGRLLGQFSGP